MIIYSSGPLLTFHSSQELPESQHPRTAPTTDFRAERFYLLLRVAWTLLQAKTYQLEPGSSEEPTSIEYQKPL
jgi:hypothetical protein